MNKLHLTSVKVLKDLYKEFKYEALKNDQTLQKVVNRSLGVAEHSDIMDSVEKELAIMAEYEDKLEILNKYFPVEDFPSKEVLNG